MKKAILVFGLVAAGFGIKAQSIQVNQQTTLWEAKYGFIELRDDRQNNKPWSFFLPFQNVEYSHITDIGGVTFSDIDALKTFVGTCKQMLDHESKNLTVDGKGYRLNRYDFNPSVIYVTETRSGIGKYFVLNETEVSEIQSVIASL